MRGRLGRGSSPRPLAPPAPQTNYRTTWKRVPVTRYRPENSSDPITGQTVTVMKPCTTFTWRPVRRRCGFFARLFGLCDPAPVAMACPAPALSQGAVSTPSAGTPPGGTPAPYYVPGSPTPAAEPGTRGPTARPGGGATRGAPRPSEPADRRPSLEPGEVQPGAGDTSSSSSSSSPSRAGAGPRRAEKATPELGPSRSSSHSFRQTPSEKTVPLPGGGSSEKSRNVPKPRPVPDPDAVPAPKDENSGTPELLNPRDRVAKRKSSPAWEYAAIAWTDEKTTPPAKNGNADSDKPARESLDDGGWYSIAP